MQLFLVDINTSLVEAWRRAFEPFPEVTVLHENILAVAENTIVSPANSHGIMDGGIDAVYVRHFGPGVERAVQDAIARRPGGLVPVGAAVLVGTGDARIPYLIAAPTMEAPQRVEAQHCYRATRAALRVAREHSALVSKLFFPGMGTGVGAVPPQDAAQEMAAAYADWQRAE